jgi:hypothetical protein
VQQARAPDQAEHDDGDHGERGQDTEDRLQIPPTALGSRASPLASLDERMVGPVGEKDGQR